PLRINNTVPLSTVSLETISIIIKPLEEIILPFFPYLSLLFLNVFSKKVVFSAPIFPFITNKEYLCKQQ
uniref:hypothetical protein n=1 Tax=Phocaeicola dorei TaxID=357276 RepID=UPI0040280A3F